MRQRSPVTALLLLTALLLAGCAPRAAPQTPAPPGPTPTGPAPLAAPTSPAPPPSPTPAPPAAEIVVDAAQARPFDRRLLGTNLPAWIAPDRLAQADLQRRITDLGPTLLRMPGGSWSNAYSWEACERGSADGCYWPWAARPSDFLSFLRATGQEGIWTVSINGTAQEAAALVAFFNGAVDDERPIGVDLRGRDWRTVGHWARLRAEGGNPEPLPIHYWEVGNEVYGGKSGNGPDCAPWGWEDVWTCDGAEYVLGVGSGADRREGYLEFRAAMRAVDPSILVGAVGIASPDDWSNWGNEVIEQAGADLDFYVVHLYAFESEPGPAASVLPLPQQIWPRMARELNAAFDRYVGRRVPVAVTEYNLVAFQDQDNAQLMRRAANFIYTADTIGQMAEHGVIIANQWNLANGVADNGTDYGLIDSASFAPNPQYYSLALWQRFGAELLAVETVFRADRELSVYAGRAPDGTISLLVINKTDRPITAGVLVAGVTGPLAGRRDVVAAESLEAQVLSVNGVPNPAGPLDALPGQELGPVSGSFQQSFDPYSVTLLRLSPQG
jgi:hypothetical protein